MIKNTFKTLPLIIALLFVLPSVSFAEPSVGDQGNAVVVGPSTTDQGTASANQNVISGNPSVTDQGNASANQNITSGNPSVTDQGNASQTGATPPITTDQGNASQTGTPPITPPADNGGGNGSGPVGSTGGGSSSSSGSTVTFVAGTSPTLTSISQCEYIKNYLKLGGNNSTSEVNKLQVFLKNNEKLDVDVTGIFDEKTFKAVEAFQAKYLNETMLPWGVTTPTGQVYFTTKDKINEVYCKTNFTLTAEQIREIEAYRLAFINGTIESADEVIVGTITSTTSIPLNGEGIEGETGETQTASVAGTSFFGRVWKFIKGIFGR